MRNQFFRTLWGIYCISVLAIFILVSYFLIFIGKLIPGLNAKHWPDYLCMNFILPLFFLFSFIRVRVLNKEKLDPNRQYIIVSNHTTYLDILLNIYAYRRPFRFLSKSENAKIPLAAYFIKSLTILVDRNDELSRKLSFRQMSIALQDGYTIMIYPEGTRNSGKDLLGKFQDGAFRLAIQNEVPILPMTIHNASEIADPRRFISFSPGTITCVYATPVETNSLNNTDVESLKLKVRKSMHKQLEDFSEKSSVFSFR